MSMVLSGSGVPSASGLDDETKNALRAIGRAHPNATDELMEAARSAFAGQLDGSNTARWRAERHRALAEREERSKRSE
ncbi:hypothetical protein GFY24_38235 [Nocardia sp. SYP-A9097]|nr:hypothetical protein [Nocardia sp. SYP-A9097]